MLVDFCRFELVIVCCVIWPFFIYDVDISFTGVFVIWREWKMLIGNLGDMI